MRAGEFEEYDILAFGGHRTDIINTGNHPQLDELLSHMPYPSLTLFDVRALEWAYYIFESDDPESELVLPVDGPTCSHTLVTIAEKERYELCKRILVGTSGEKELKKAEQDGLFVLMFAKRHMQGLALHKIPRLTHRAKTGNSARFVARDRELLKGAIKEQQKIEERYLMRMAKKPGL